MGWWSVEIMGGDTPLDCLIGFEAELGLDGLDVPEWGDALREAVRSTLDARSGAELVALAQSIDTSEICVQVLASVVMAAGARMDPELRTAALRAGEADSWATREPERAQVIAEYLHAVQIYDGTPVPICYSAL